MDGPNHWLQTLGLSLIIVVILAQAVFIVALVRKLLLSQRRVRRVLRPVDPIQFRVTPEQRGKAVLN